MKKEIKELMEIIKKQNQEIVNLKNNVQDLEMNFDEMFSILSKHIQGEKK